LIRSPAFSSKAFVRLSTRNNYTGGSAESTNRGPTRILMG
jgi:hypothetical protein